MKKYLLLFLFYYSALKGFSQAAFLLEYRTGNNPVSDEGAGIQKTSDGGFIIGGRRDPTFSSIYDFELIKINSDGTIQWSYSYDVGGSEYMTHIRQTADGGYLMYGNSGANLLIIKTNNSGTPLWGWTYAGMTTVEPSKFREETINPNGGFILAGAEIGLGSGGGFRDGYLLRLAADGSLRWGIAYGLNTREDFFNDVAEDNDGRWSVASNYGIGASSRSVWFLIDSIGTSIQRQREISTGSTGYFSASYVNTSSSVGAGQYFLAGRIGVNMYIARTCNVCTGNITNTRYSRSISINDGSGYSTEAFSIDSVTGENAIWLSGKIYGAIAADAASIERDFLFVKVDMSATSPFAPTSIAASTAVGTATYDESADEGTIVSASEYVALGTNNGDPWNPGASLRIKLAKSNTVIGNCDYRDLTASTTIAATGASAGGSAPTITTITGSITASVIPLGTIIQTNLASGIFTTQDCFLPVTLLSFSGKPENHTVKLSWSTASEQNNNYFTLEHSADGKTFSEIGKMNGAGNSNIVRKYEFVDESPAEQNNYRLSQTDFDGQHVELGIVFVKMLGESNGLQLTVQSNPVTTNNLSLNLSSFVDDEITLNITDLQGRVIRSEKTSAAKNESKLVSVDLSEISKGAYFITATGKSSSVNSKFILLNRE